MKVLYENYIKTATIEGSAFATAAFPPNNIKDKFLVRPFISSAQNDFVKITITETPSGAQINSIYISVMNAALLTVEFFIVSNLVTPYLTKIIDASAGQLSSFHFSLSQTYQIKISGVTSDYFAINSVGVGVSYQIDDVVSGFGISTVNETVRVRTPGGQVLSTRAPSLKKRDLEIPILRESGRVKVYEVLDKLEKIGIGAPTFWDISENDTSFETPIYAEIPEIWSVSDLKNRYVINLTILEAR